MLDKIEKSVRGRRKRPWILQMLHAGQGGSSATGNVLRSLGIVPELYVLDHTDPAAFNAMLLGIAQMAPPKPDEDFGAWKNRLKKKLKKALPHLLLVPMALGMTSEEAVINFAVLYGIAEELGLAKEFKKQVWALTFTGSSVDNAMRARGFGDNLMQVQLNGEQAVPGRGSAPAATPIAFYPIYFHALKEGRDPFKALKEWNDRAVLSRDSLETFEKLAVTLHALVRAGKNKFTLVLPPGWEHFEEWVKQIFEESEGVDRKETYNTLLGKTISDRNAEPELKIITNEQSADPRFVREASISDRAFLVFDVAGVPLKKEQQTHLSILKKAGHPV